MMLATSMVASSQNISLALYQDGKMLFKGDEDRGYKAGTINLLFRAKIKSEYFEHGYFVLSPEYEYAEIGNIYKRYSINGGFTFDNLELNILGTNVLENIEFTPMIGWGWIYRENIGGGDSYGLSAEISYKINDWLNLNFVNQWTKRADLENKKLGYSLFGGIEITVFNRNTRK